MERVSGRMAAVLSIASGLAARRLNSQGIAFGAVLLVVCASSANVSAGILSFYGDVIGFQGSVPPGSPIAVGDQLSGYIEFDDSAPDDPVNNPPFHIYQAFPRFSIAVGRYAAAKIAGVNSPGNVVEVGNNVQLGDRTTDELTFYIDREGIIGAPINGGRPYGFRLDLVDREGTWLTSGALPTDTSDLSAVDANRAYLWFDVGGPVVTAQLSQIAWGLLPGVSLQNPILPIAGAGTPTDPWAITGRSSLWSDPPATDGFVYEMTSNSLFTSILDFPTGFSQPFSVTADGALLGQFGPGQTVDFVSLLGHGVSRFSIDGISPSVDSQNPLGFPLRLAFNTETANFTMRPFAEQAASVPEPASLSMFLVGLCAVASVRLRKRHV